MRGASKLKTTGGSHHPKTIQIRDGAVHGLGGAVAPTLVDGISTDKQTKSQKQVTILEL